MLKNYLFRWRGSPWLRTMLLFALPFFDLAFNTDEPTPPNSPPKSKITCASKTLANLVLLSLKTEIKKLRVTQETMQANSGASIMHVNHRLELLDRMLSLLERQQTLQADLDTSPPVREILLRKIVAEPDNIKMPST